MVGEVFEQLGIFESRIGKIQQGKTGASYMVFSVCLELCEASLALWASGGSNWAGGDDDDSQARPRWSFQVGAWPRAQMTLTGKGRIRLSLVMQAGQRSSGAGI